MKTEKCFGGELLKGKRKSARILCTKRAIHLVLRAKENHLRKKEREIQEVITKAAKRWGIKVYRNVVNTNHIHMVIRIPTRHAYRHFIQWISGTIALKFKISWLVRPFTRITEWGRDFRIALTYLRQNWLEASGRIPYWPRTPRKRSSALRRAALCF